MLDLLTLCVEAGLSTQAALDKIGEHLLPSPLQEEIKKLQEEIQLGTPRSEAMRHLTKRVELPVVTSTFITLIQAEKMGVDLAKTLQAQSEMVRMARFREVQEMARKAPLKLVFPVTFLIFPVIFIVIFGPILLNLSF